MGIVERAQGSPAPEAPGEVGLRAEDFGPRLVRREREVRHKDTLTQLYPGRSTFPPQDHQKIEVRVPAVLALRDGPEHPKGDEVASLSRPQLVEDIPREDEPW